MQNKFEQRGFSVPEREERELRELYAQMIQVAYKRVNNKSDVHDAVQDAWVNILSKWGTLRERGKLAAWAKAITANVACNINRRSRRGVIATEQCAEAEASRHSDVKAQLMLEISELLGALDPTSRTLLLYKFYYGFKDQEIADAMNVPIGTIKARIHRTREKLKGRMVSSEADWPM
ncbi:sigma-70 family RNA polymerase sigma factor [Paenibacillus beijingensis]|uniref:Sigma-70 family RNA polymerase sigma factor n=2 Tax=Paenibacillus beijingensis TaxID=1126833 RepID=A0A0D5NR39_9BACL|nr:sigma-70 family RNA polymerase sigma factor [Paenibacillus beijingensis]